MTLLESSPAASALLQLVAAELRCNKCKGCAFASPTVCCGGAPPQRPITEQMRRSSTASVLGQLWLFSHSFMQTAAELHRSLLLFSAIPVAEELFSNGDC
jgi:hypothetical protein